MQGGKMNRRLLYLTFAWFALTFCLGYLLVGCSPSAAEQDRMLNLAKIKRVALITFFGISMTNSNDTIHAPLVKKMYTSFNSAAVSHSDVIEFMPISQVVKNDAYRRIATIVLPKGVVSPIEGLTTPSQGVGPNEIVDGEPLMRSLGVDAVMVVITKFGVAIRDNGTAPYLIGKVYAALAVKPDKRVWGSTSTKQTMDFEEIILATIFSHPVLMGSIGVKWVGMQKPSEAEYAELIKIAIEQDTQLPKIMGKAILENLVTDIQKARKWALKTNKIR